MFLIVFMLLCAVVFVSDIRKRIIPNYVLIAVVLLKALFLVIEFDLITLFDSVIGFTVASVVFLIPKFLRMPLGWGDVKFSAVLGFSLGFVKYIYSMLLAVLLVFLYCIVRKTVMKKDIEDFKLPLGSFMSAGAILICIFEFIL